tara:strand:+ start:641 stop:898 length:258 start_codon:yes stop_codon:yes gene_type:complete
MEIREHKEPGTPAGEIRITQYGNSLEDVEQRFKDTVNMKSVVRLPSYSGPDSLGRWKVFWWEKTDYTTQTSSWPGWNRRKNGEKK